MEFAFLLLVFDHLRKSMEGRVEEREEMNDGGLEREVWPARDEGGRQQLLYEWFHELFV